MMCILLFFTKQMCLQLDHVNTVATDMSGWFRKSHKAYTQTTSHENCTNKKQSKTEKKGAGQQNYYYIVIWDEKKRKL